MLITFDTQTVALVVGAIAAVFSSPWIMARQVNSAARRKQKEDYERADELEAQKKEEAKEIAAVAKNAAEAVAAKQEEAAFLLLEQSNLMALTARNQEVKLDQIHALVNSNLTALMRAHLESRKETKILLEELVVAYSLLDRPASPIILLRIQKVAGQISEIEAVLRDRVTAPLSSEGSKSPV